jgi:hypothetical protein
MSGHIQHKTNLRKDSKALLAVNTFEGLVFLAVCWLVLCQLLRGLEAAVAHVASEQCISLGSTQEMF